MRIWHIHYSGNSRDCDGRNSYGLDIPGKMTPSGLEDDVALASRALGLIYRSPDVSPVFIRIDHDHDGRVTIRGGGETEEGYWSEQYVICESDDYEPDYSGLRDHTAERMGY